MPPLSETQHMPSTPARHGSYPVAAAADDAHGEDKLQHAMREALTNFVTDTMYDKPENLLQYMAAWAKKQQGATARLPRTLSPSPPPARVSGAAARHAQRGASAEPQPAAVKAQTGEHEAVDNTAAQIMTMAHQRQQHFRDKAQGCRDHYLISLEDSDGDIFHVNGLQKKMTASRKAELDAKADTAAVASRLQEIAESDATEETKTERRTEMLHTYERLWEGDMPKKRNK